MNTKYKLEVLIVIVGFIMFPSNVYAWGQFMPEFLLCNTLQEKTEIRISHFENLQVSSNILFNEAPNFNSSDQNFILNPNECRQIKTHRPSREDHIQKFRIYVKDKVGVTITNETKDYHADRKHLTNDGHNWDNVWNVREYSTHGNYAILAPIYKSLHHNSGNMLRTRRGFQDLKVYGEDTLLTVGETNDHNKYTQPLYITSGSLQSLGNISLSGALNSLKHETSYVSYHICNKSNTDASYSVSYSGGINSVASSQAGILSNNHANNNRLGANMCTDITAHLQSPSGKRHPDYSYYKELPYFKSHYFEYLVYGGLLLTPPEGFLSIRLYYDKPTMKQSYIEYVSRPQKIFVVDDEFAYSGINIRHDDLKQHYNVHYMLKNTSLINSVLLSENNYTGQNLFNDKLSKGSIPNWWNVIVTSQQAGGGCGLANGNKEYSLDLFSNLINGFYLNVDFYGPKLNDVPTSSVPELYYYCDYQPFKSNDNYKYKYKVGEPGVCTNSNNILFDLENKKSNCLDMAWCKNWTLGLINKKSSKCQDGKINNGNRMEEPQRHFLK